jgi:GGDEF domain-containing protein
VKTLERVSDGRPRIGGEEFAILRPAQAGTNVSSLADFLEKLKEKHIAHESSRVADT